MAKTVADMLVERLIDWGVDTIFGFPGDGINGIFEALGTSVATSPISIVKPPLRQLPDGPDYESRAPSPPTSTAHVPNRKITWEGWEDAAVPPEKLGNYLRDFRKRRGDEVETDK
jgi:hypothetical protein